MAHCFHQIPKVYYHPKILKTTALEIDLVSSLLMVNQV